MPAQLLSSGCCNNARDDLDAQKSVLHLHFLGTLHSPSLLVQAGAFAESTAAVLAQYKYNRFGRQIT